mmetsp:Transcript_4797/g.9486  ORF Transcript_4797/g.9486 Transcript_4797/m.9486 type:complete len:101 (+) Transcript_4797:1333-1635(+)
MKDALCANKHLSQPMSNAERGVRALLVSVVTSYTEFCPNSHNQLNSTRHASTDMLPSITSQPVDPSVFSFRLKNQTNLTTLPNPLASSSRTLTALLNPRE